MGVARELLIEVCPASIYLPTYIDTLCDVYMILEIEY